MIRIIALDDEPLALDVIRHYCLRMEEISLEKVFVKPSEALRYINKFPVDLILLDIEMAAISGIDFYRSIKQDTKVIFTTAYSQYAVHAFEVNASDYLVKPFSFERFAMAIEKVKHSLSEHSMNNYLFIRADYKLNKIGFDEIALIESLDDYVRIYLENKDKIVARYSMKDLLNRLPESLFVRIHRSYIIPLRKVKSIQQNSVQMDDFVLPIGDRYKGALARFL
jgi:DNA-binding LytR/AlgR family response regulator